MKPSSKKKKQVLGKKKPAAVVNPHGPWTPSSPATNVPPRITGQFVAMGQAVLVLRRPQFATIHVMDAKFYMFMLLAFSPVLLYMMWEMDLEFDMGPGAPGPNTMFVLGVFMFIFGFGALLARRLRILKRMNHAYFNRHTQRIYIKTGADLWEGEWHGVQADSDSFTEFAFGGSHFSSVTRHTINLLVPKIGPMPPRYRTRKKIPPGMFPLAIMRNNDGAYRAAEVWEYIRAFMAHGPEGLPIPAEPDWLELPGEKIVLTPREAWRRHVPWRNGALGERQVKKNFLLPLWAALFPILMPISLCWWLLCRIFRVGTPVPPPQALQGETGPLVTIDMASRGIRP
uniref:hypothetical protein n=1 Tax=Castellaniella defragrans TaxID=75697 RepID=UPI00333F8AEC